MDRIIILGAGVMQGPVIRIAGEMGLERHVLDGNAEAMHKGSGEYFYHIDLRDKERILELAAGLKEKPGRLGVITAGTDFSVSVAYVTEKLGLPGHSYEAALNATDKARMRACFDKEGVPSPQWLVVDEAALREGGALRGGCPPAEGGSRGPKGRSVGGGIPPHAREGTLTEWRFPLVVKPCDSMGARGCIRVDSMEELEAAAVEAMRISPTGRAIIEEYMDGAEFSVDAIVHNGTLYECGFADRYITCPPYFVEIGHTIPADIGADTKQQLMRCFDAGVQALGLTEVAVKGDL
jgi:biotin carboxylase